MIVEYIPHKTPEVNEIPVIKKSIPIKNKLYFFVKITNILIIIPNELDVIPKALPAQVIEFIFEHANGFKCEDKTNPIIETIHKMMERTIFIIDPFTLY